MTFFGPRARTAVRDALLVAPGYAIPGLASLIGVPVLFRAFGAAEYGLWSLINAIASGVPPLTTSSVEAMTLRFSHRDPARRRLSEWVLAIAFSAGSAALLAGLLIPAAGAEAIVVTAALSAGVGAYLIRIASLHSRLRFGTSSAAASLRAVVGMGLAIAGAIATGSAILAALGLAAGFAVATLVSPIGGRAQRVSTGELGNAKVTGQGRIRYGLGSIVVAVGLFVLSVGDRFILSALSGLAGVGIYAAAYTIEDLIIRLAPTVLQVAIRPRIFQAWDGANTDRVTSGTVGMAALISWLGLVLTSGIIVAGHLLGVSTSVMQLLGPLGIGLSASVAATSVSFLYSAAERQWRLAANVVAGALVNTVLNLIWIPEIGGQGAAFATAVSFVALLGLHLFTYRRELSKNVVHTSLGLGAIGSMTVVGFGSSLSGGAIWPVAGLMAAVLLIPLGRRSLRLLLKSLD